MLKNPPRFHNPLIDWYLENGRDLPWRRTRDPYLVWLSEIILQQTRVDQGMPYYLDFATAYPTVKHLAEASEEEVLKRWQGLGYYSRARNLHHTARHVVEQLDGVFPGTYNELIKLKGVGDYTASAIASICSDEACAVVDGNVFRLLGRLYAIDTPINSTAGKHIFKEKSQELIDPQRPGTFNQATMEFGARYCVPANPDCPNCIFSKDCLAYSQGKVSQLPVKKPKNPSRKIHMYFLVVVGADGTTILEQRTAGIWNHLYQFPLLESAQALNLKDISKAEEFAPYLKEMDAPINFFDQDPVQHKLSHRDLSIWYCIVHTKTNGPKAIPIGAIRDYPVPVVLERFISGFGPFSE